MRIIAGQFGSRRIAAPPGMVSRPTADRVREALFSMLAPFIEDADVLDLFAGSGALSLEALSRGARSALLCDTDAGACAAIHSNIAALGVGDSARLQKRDALSLAGELLDQNRAFDIIFLDPPYGAGLMPRALEISSRLLKAGGRVVAETDASMEPAPPSGLIRAVSRKYGDTRVSIFTRKDEETEE